MRNILILLSVLGFSCSQNLNDPASREGLEDSSIVIPKLNTGNKTIDQAFRIAIGDLFTNIQDFEIQIYDTSAPVIIAGLDYDRPWTRDAAINCWNAGSFIMPVIAKNTLLSTLIDDGGSLRIGGQYWDAIIWATGAWNHYKCTGDEEFLQIAYEATTNSLHYFELTELNSKYNLFRGLGWSDGVAAYEGKYAFTNGFAAAHSWPEHNPEKISKPGYGIPMMATSTNCLYYNAYEVVVKMANELKTDASDWSDKAISLKEAINKHLWNESGGVYRFYIDEDEESKLQETLGNAYAIIFGVADEQKTNSIFRNQFVAPAGVPCGWPPLSRYRNDSLSFGRHNGVVWPQIQGFWAQAASKFDKPAILFHELDMLAKHAVRDKQFAEIYHPVSGEIYGGMQERNGRIIEWQATNRQTWSATAYIRMVIFGLTGTNIDENGISFSPCIPDELDKVVLSNLQFRNMLLNISVQGNGSKVSKILINGKNADRAIIPGDASGPQTIIIELE